MKEQKINSRAAIITVAVHVLLLLLFLVAGYTLPSATALPDEMGMEVNLGNSTDGSGDDQPFMVDRPSQDATAASSGETAENTVPKDLMSSDDDEDSRSVRSQRERTSNNGIERNNNKPQELPKPKLLYPGATGNGGNGAAEERPGKGEGNGTGAGDKGVPGGTPGAANYEGIPGSGNGTISYSLSNRSIVAFPEKEAVFRENGKVVIRITVNRDGDIISKTIISGTNAELKRLALQKIEKVRFNKSSTAPQEQFGTLTFVFRTRYQ